MNIKVIKSLINFDLATYVWLAFTQYSEVELCNNNKTKMDLHVQ